jgi:hypothetical protein
MKKEGLSLKSFWLVHKSVAQLVVNAEDVDKILEQEGSWQPIADIVASVVNDSNLGAKMFGWLLSSIQAERMELFTERIIKEKLSDTVEPDTVSEVHKLCVQEATRLGALINLRERRDIIVKYRGIELVCKDVRSYEEELNLRVASFLKTRAVGGKVPVLAFENSVLEPPSEEVAKDPRIHKEVLDEFSMARNTANEMLKDQVLSGDLVKEMLTKKAQVCMQVDKTFKLEMALLDTACGEGGVKRVQDLVIQALPTSASRRTLEESMQQLAMLSQKAPLIVLCVSCISFC